MNNHEVEVKYRIEDASKMKRLLDQKCKFLRREDQQDEVLLFNKSSFDDFVQGEAVMRVRSINNKSILTMKKYVSQDSSQEYECEISSKSEVIGILKGIGFRTVVEINKVREVYSYDDVTVVLDEVEGLGSFLEIEIVCSEEKKDEALERVKLVSKQLGLKNTAIETRKYDALLAAQ